MLVTELLDINSLNTSQFAKWNNINFSGMLTRHLLYACVASWSSERAGEIYDAEFLKCLPWCDFSFATYFKNYFTVIYFQTIFFRFLFRSRSCFLKTIYIWNYNAFVSKWKSWIQESCVLSFCRLISVKLCSVFHVIWIREFWYSWLYLSFNSCSIVPE